MSTKETKDEKCILEELAYALTEHESSEYGSRFFVDITEGRVTFIPEDNGLVDSEAVKTINACQKHEIIEINHIPSSFSFRIMEDFTNTRNVHEKAKLYKALDCKHPFGNFYRAVHELGIHQQWYNFKDEVEIVMAKKWLADNELTIKDGKIIKIK